MSTVPSVAAIRFAIASSADVVSAASAVSVAAAVLPPAALSVVSSLLPHAAKETTMLVASNTLNTFFFIENFLPFSSRIFAFPNHFTDFCAFAQYFFCFAFCIAICFVFCCVPLLCFVAFRFLRNRLFDGLSIVRSCFCVNVHDL